MTSPFASPSEKGSLQFFQRARSRWQASPRTKLSPIPITEFRSPDSLLLKTTPKTIKTPEVAVEKKLFQAEEPADDKVAPSKESKETQCVTDSPVHHRERLVAFYEKFNPSKLDTVDATLRKYQGKEDEMFLKLEQKYNSGAFPPPSGTGPTCFLNFQDRGRVEVQLFSDKTPLACENFRALCTGELNKGYCRSLVHRIVPNFCIQGGDFTKGDGTGGESIYPPNSEHGDMWGKFKDEFFMQHNQKGLLSMANNGKDRNGSQFFVTLAPLPHLDGKHVVFGKVIKGMNVVEAISKTPTDKNQRPLEQVVISGCGEVRNGEDFFLESKMVAQGPCSFGAGCSSASPFGSNDPKASPFSFSSASAGKLFSFGGSGATQPCSFAALSPALPSAAFSFSNSRPATEEAAPLAAFNFSNTKPSTKTALDFSGLYLKPDERNSGSLLSVDSHPNVEADDDTDSAYSASTPSDTSESEGDEWVVSTREPAIVSTSPLDFLGGPNKICQPFSIGAASIATGFVSNVCKESPFSLSASTDTPVLRVAPGVKPATEKEAPSTGVNFTTSKPTDKAPDFSGLSLKADEEKSESLSVVGIQARDDEPEDDADSDSSTSTPSDTSEPESTEEEVSTSTPRRVSVASRRRRESSNTKETAYNNPFTGIDFAEKVQADSNPFSGLAACSPTEPRKVDDSLSATEKPTEQRFSFGQPSVGPKSFTVNLPGTSKTEDRVEEDSSTKTPSEKLDSESDELVESAKNAVSTFSRMNVVVACSRRKEKTDTKGCSVCKSPSKVGDSASVTEKCTFSFAQHTVSPKPSTTIKTKNRDVEDSSVMSSTFTFGSPAPLANNDAPDSFSSFAQARVVESPSRRVKSRVVESPQRRDKSPPKPSLRCGDKSPPKAKPGFAQARVAESAQQKIKTPPKVSPTKVNPPPKAKPEFRRWV